MDTVPKGNFGNVHRNAQKKFDLLQRVMRVHSPCDEGKSAQTLILSSDPDPATCVPRWVAMLSTVASPSTVSATWARRANTRLPCFHEVLTQTLPQADANGTRGRQSGSPHLGHLPAILLGHLLCMIGRISIQEEETA